MIQEINSYNKYLSKTSHLQIIVVGDVMIDKYIEGDITRISPEAPVPVVNLNKTQTSILGGAGNVFNNLISLGCKNVYLSSIIGCDEDGSFINEYIKSKGCSSDCITIDESRPTTVKTRIMSQRQQIVRLDVEDSNNINLFMKESILFGIEKYIKSTNIIIISDYEKGLIDHYLISRIIELSKKYDVPVFVDPKEKNFHLYKNIHTIMPNKIEAEKFVGFLINTEDDIKKAAFHIKNKLNCENVIIKRSEKGMYILNKINDSQFIDSNIKQVYDVTGAGDTAISTLAVAYASGATINKSAFISNVAAGIVVGEYRTTSIDIDKLKNKIMEINNG